MIEGAFELEAFYAQVAAAAKERSALRQDLVRGLKDYYVSLYGYDRYGAETVLLLSDRMSQPLIYGYGVLRILHDRRIAEATKIASALRALAIIDATADNGLPYGLIEVLHFLLQRDAVTLEHVRYALVATAGSDGLFAGAERSAVIGLVQWLVDQSGMPDAERAFWGHSLVSRYAEGAGAPNLANALLGAETIPPELRAELARAWVNARQPRLFVDIPDSDGSPDAEFVLRHMPFWVSHAPSWPSPAMVRVGLIWLARLDEDPVQVVDRYIAARDDFGDAIHAAIAEILSEHRASIPESSMKRLIEQGLALSDSSPTRRGYYRLGSDLFGAEYLQRASGDSANSVRQWAAKQLQHQAFSG